MARRSKKVQQQESLQHKVGSYAFIAGVIIAIFSSFAGITSVEHKAYMASALILLGIIVGFLNVTNKETKEYLFAATALVVITALGGFAIVERVYMLGPWLANIFTAILTFVVPSTIVVSLKAIFALAKDE